ncbi:MAG: MFS transporter [Candidatus Methanosuratincola petrocarbonis]|nr:MFS transporter [Candidatus Methanosuratincola sp.]
MRALISQVWRVNLATMLFFTLIQVVVPLIPRYALTVSASPFLIGLAVSAISITAIFLRPISGFLSDTWARSRLMVLGLVFGSGAYLILFISSDIYQIMLGRLLEGAGVALFVPSSMASAVDQAPDGKVGETLGWRSLMIGLGFTVGPALGGFLAEAFGYTTTFGITSILILLLLPLVLYREPRREKGSLSLSIKGLSEKHFVVAFLSLVVYAIAWMGLLTFLSAYLKIIGYGDLQIGLFVSIQAVSSLALRIFAGRAADKNPALMTYVGLLLISFAFLLIAMNQEPLRLYIDAVIFGLGIGIFVPGSQTLALAHAHAGSRGFLSSIYTMGMDIGNMVGPLVFGAVIQASGSYPESFLIAPVLTFIAALVVLIPERTGRLKEN